MAAARRDGSEELVYVTLTSAGLESALQRITQRVDELDMRTRSHHYRKDIKPVDTDAGTGADAHAHAEDDNIPGAAHAPHLVEISAIQSLDRHAPDQRLEVMADALVSMAHNINKFYKDVKHREAVQQETDTAQDEMMHMELDNIINELGQRVTRKDSSNMRKLLLTEMKGMRAEMENDFGEQLADISKKVSEQLLRVMDQVRVIKESSQATNELLNDRIADAFLDIQSASEDMDIKIRKINRVFGVGADPNAEPPSLEEINDAIAELRNTADTLKGELENQEAAAAALNASMSEMQGTVEEKLETLSDAVNRDFGESMAKVVSDLETGMGALEEKVGGEMAQRLGHCTRKLVELEEQLENKEASATVVVAAQEAMTEQAKVQEEALQGVQEELMATLEKSIGDRIETVAGEMSTLGEKLEEATAVALTSAETMTALGTNTKALQKELEAAQKRSKNEMEALSQKMAEQLKEHGSTAEALSSDVAELIVVARNNRSELESHISTYDAFVTTTTRGQDLLSSEHNALSTDVKGYKEESRDRIARVERSNISVVTTMRSLKRAVDALATKEARWDRLEVQHKRHAQVLGGQLAELEGEAAFPDPFIMSMSTQKNLSAVSQMVAKNIATRADYEVTRQIMGRKNATEEPDWDRKVEALRNRYLERFVGDVVEVANRLRPNPDRVVGEVRETYATKLELSMRLAISKYKSIQAGATILGKVQLLPACMACDRPFIDNPGPGDQRATAPDRRELRETSANRSRSSSPRGVGCRSPGGGALPFMSSWTGVGSGGASAGQLGSPVPASSLGGSCVEDDGSVGSITSLGESQVSGTNSSRYTRAGTRGRSRDKYVMKAGFKMRQSNSEGGLISLVGVTRGGNAADYGFDDIEGSSTANSSGGGSRRNVGLNSEGWPRDQISGSPLDLKLATRSAQVGSRRDRAAHAQNSKHKERQGGWSGAAGGVGRGGIVNDGDDFLASPIDENASINGEINLERLPTLH